MGENIRNSSVTVGTSSTVVSNDLTGAQRSVIILTNNSTGGQKIYLAWGAEANASAGIPLAVGGFHAEAIDAGFKPSNQQITAVADGAGATLLIHERIISRSDLS